MNMNNRILSIHGGHTAAVISLSYSPTGKEFCSGSYDKSIRIFNVEEVSKSYLKIFLSF